LHFSLDSSQINRQRMTERQQPHAFFLHILIQRIDVIVIFNDLLGSIDLVSY
jgi:hypothetical protein